MYFKIFLILFSLIFFFNTSLVFAQDNVAKIDTPLDDIMSGDVLEKEQKQLPYIAIIITVGGVILGAYFTVRGLKMSQRKTEADLFLRLNESLYRSNEAKKIIESMRNKTRILRPHDIGEEELEKIFPNKEERDRLVTERDLENFLNEVQAVCILINHKILSPEFAEPGFVWVIQRVKENNEIMKYIKNAQDNNYGYYSWGEIAMYKDRDFKRAVNYDDGINFKRQKHT